MGDEKGSSRVMKEKNARRVEYLTIGVQAVFYADHN